MNEPTVTKICTKCQTEKSVLKFSKHALRKDGLSPWCKRCHKKYYLAYYLANRHAIAAYKKEWYEANKEVIVTHQKEYRQTENGKSTRRKFHENNPEYMKEYAQTENGKNALKKGAHKRRALKLNATVEDFNPIEVFERDGYKCQSCGIKTRYYKTKFHPKSPELDHIVPLSLGGEHSKANTQCLCAHCNRTKHNTGTGDQLRIFG